MKPRARKTLLGLTLPVSAASGLIWLNSETGSDWLARQISSAASSTEMTINIGAIENPLSSRIAIRDVTLGDAKGVWLRIDHIAIDWSRLALLRGVARIDRLQVDHVSLLRAPPKSPQDSANDQPLIPRLPVDLQLNEFSVAKMEIAEPVMGVTAHFNARGVATLADGGAAVKLVIERSDAPGSVQLDARIPARLADARLDLHVSEPEGGLIARLASIENLPALELDLKSGGGPDDFNARLTAKGGSSLDATGELRISRDGDSRNLALQLDASIPALLPPSANAAFPGVTRVTALARLDDNGAVDVHRLDMSGQVLQLGVSGSLLKDGQLDFTGSLKQTGALADKTFRAKTLDGAFRAAGTLLRPDVSFQLDGEDISTPAGQFGSVLLVARATPDGVATRDPRIAVELDATGERLAWTDKAYADAIGPALSATLRARVDLSGQADVTAARIAIKAGEASFIGKAGMRELAGRLSLSAPNLAALSKMAGRDLRGALSVETELSGSPAQRRIDAKVSGSVASPQTGFAAIDGLAGSKLSLSGDVAFSQPKMSFNRFVLAGEHATINLDGHFTADDVSLKLLADFPELDAADERLEGQAKLSASLDGPLKSATGKLSLQIESAKAADKAIPALTLRADAADVFGAAKATIHLDGTVDGKTATGRVNIKHESGLISVDDLNVAVGRSSLQGSLALDQNRLATGSIKIVTPDLNDLSAFAMSRLAGKLDAHLMLEVAAGAQNVTLVAKAEGVRTPMASIDRLDARFSARDVLRRPALDGNINIDNAKVGQELIPSARITAKPSGAGAALDLALVARGFTIQGRGELIPGDRSVLTISSLSARKGAQQLAITRLATIAFGGGGLDVKNVSVSTGAGRIEIDGAIGNSLDLVARLRAVPLSTAAFVDPALKLDGTVDAEARITGTAATPAGDWKLNVSKFASAETRSLGAPPVSLNGRGRLSGGRTSIDADMAVGPKSRISITGSAPLDPEGAMDLAIKGVIDAALANTMLSANGQSLKGRAQLDLRVAGQTASPALDGNVSLAEGAFDDPLMGVSIRNIRARLDAKGREIDVTSFSAETKNGGKIGLSGRLSLVPENDFPGQFRLTTRNAQLVGSDTVTAVADMDVEISGALARSPKVAGKIVLQAVDVAIPERLPANLKPIPGTTHIDARGFARQMLDLEQKQKQKKAASSGRKAPFDATLDLTISAPSRIFVRGRGIDAEFAGDLALKGTTQQPVVVGSFDLRRGKLDMLTQRIAMTRGKLSFVGGIVPELDFAAETAAGDVTASVNVTGAADAPSFSFSSSPELPQDEVLARLLFRKAAASLTPVQAVQLATAIAQFSGAGSGIDAFEKMRRALGVDALDIDVSGPSGPKVGASRYLTSNVSVGVKTGAKPEESSVNVGIDLFRGVRAQAETSMDGKSSIGIGFEFEY